MAFTRVYVMREFSYARGGMRNLAYIGATILNFGLAWAVDVCAAQTKTKIQNLGANVGYNTHMYHPSQKGILL